MVLTPQQNAVVERGRRLIALRQNGGYADLITLSEKLVQESQRAVLEYSGFLKDELAALQQESRGALHHHNELVRAVEETCEIAQRYALRGEYSEPPELSDEQRDELAQSFLVGVN